nr:unnamed protein product [Spirometra erinaceieuropaei]
MGARRPGGPERRYSDTLKSSLKRIQINPETWKDLAQNRRVWKLAVKTGGSDRRRQSQELSLPVSGAPDPQNCHSTPPNRSTLSTNIPREDRPRRSSLDPPHQPHLLLHDRLCSNPHANHDGTHPHHRCSDPPCHTAVNQPHLHPLSHSGGGEDEHNHLYRTRYRP